MSEKIGHRTNRRDFLRNTSLLAGSLVIGKAVKESYGSEISPDKKECLNVREENNGIIIDAPFFSFCFHTKNKLKPLWWHNKLSNRRLDIRNGREIEFTTGLPGGKIYMSNLKILKLPKVGYSELNEVVFELFDDKLKAKVFVVYYWNGKEPVLKKRVKILNQGETTWNRLLDIHLGTYDMDLIPYSDKDFPVLVPKRPRSVEMVLWDDPAGRERGYPAYLENQFFVCLAHPSGFSLLSGNKLKLRHHPGIFLNPGDEFNSFEAVYGVSKPGEARSEFKKHLYSRMRRVLRGQDHPYAIIDTCGAQNETKEKFDGVSENWCLENISKLYQAKSETDLCFDNYVIEFWHDIKGNLIQCNPERFPNDFEKIVPALNNMGTNLGLWISSGYEPHGAKETMDIWTIGANPDLVHCSTTGDGKGRICRSTPPANQMYIEGFIHHIRNNHIRQIKLDSGGGSDSVTETTYNRMPLCNNSNHNHLPGILYSIEANHNAQIEFLNAIDKECREVFLTLYWGHHSPWWLLHGNTVYDIGLRMEMASLAFTPALFVRSGNVRRLDQGRYIAAKDYPAIAWDSLGVALSDWAWNGRQGYEKWQEGVVMDMCRGSMLLHIWSHNDGIPAEERPQMAEFIHLFKASPDCFKNSYAIGNPFKDDWWGYCCTNGKKAFIAIDNGSWEDQLIQMELNSSWGLPDDVEWDIYCWYPNHIKFRSINNGSFGEKEKIIIRPFSAVLLEIVPHGSRPALKHPIWKEKIMPVQFSESSQSIKISSDIFNDERRLDFQVKGLLPAFKKGGWLAVTTEFVKDGQPFFSLNNEPQNLKGRLDGNDVEFITALNNGHFPAPWQTYRLLINKGASKKEFHLSGNLNFTDKDVELKISAYYIPKD
jgi:hypothetical protein